ncbi:MAG TPA: hypothetical protein PLP48_00385 [Acholeplasmataceae bacterium]|nr:hypothetical protein [Acholeplasmataceae bacterium]
MKHLKRLFTLILLVIALLLSASTTYATTSPRITYEKIGNFVYIAFDGDINLNNSGFPSGYHDVDFRDSGEYVSGHMPISMTIEYVDYDHALESDYIQYAPSIEGELFGYLVFGLNGGGYYVDFESDDGFVLSSGLMNYLDPDDEIYMFWELPFEDASPVITGETAFVTNVDAPLTEATIRTYIYAYDETDGDLTHLIEKTSDTYTPNMNTVGTWQIVYSVEDMAGNVATLRVHVLVRDVTAPTWNVSKAEVQVSYTQTFDVEAYKSQLGVADNYDAAGSLNITVQSNNYTANKTTVGTYYVVYKIKDTAGNETLAEVEVQVIDTVAPVFSGPATLIKPSNSVLTVSQIKSQLTANDVVDGNLTASIVVQEDNYTGYGHLVGSYTITFAVTDSAGNIATHIVQIDVEDNIPPIFYVRDNYFITVDQSVSLTLGQIIDILEITGQLETSGSGGVQVTTLLNEYFGNENVPGIYAVSLKSVTVSGSESIHNVAIEVIETSDEDPIIIDEDQMWYQPVVDLYNSVKTWVKEHVLLSIGIVIGVIGLILILASSSGRGRHKPYGNRRYR